MARLLTVFALLATVAVGTTSAYYEAMMAMPNATLPNWVGPKVGKPFDTACYRKTHRMATCPKGYVADRLGATCWAQCPIEYPVDCGMECLPQNKDCSVQVLRKINAVVAVAMNFASTGVFKELQTTNARISKGVQCGSELYTIVKKLAQLIHDMQNTHLTSKLDQLRAAVGQSDLVAVDLPMAVAKCLGRKDLDKDLSKIKEIVKVVKTIVENVLVSIQQKLKGEDPSATVAPVTLVTPDAFVNITSTAGIPAVTDLTAEEIETLKQLVNTGAQCGAKIKSVIDRVIQMVKQMKQQNPDNDEDHIRFMVANSNIVIKDLPEATTQCVKLNAPDGFKTRDEIMKTAHVIIDRIVEASSQNGNPVPVSSYVITVANMGLDAISYFDPTGLANLAKEYIQPICGPTAFLGEIDDGPADKALGMRAMDKVFQNSTGQWTKAGSDGLAKLTFENCDKFDLYVNVRSGGEKVMQMPIKAGESMVWTKPLSELEGKTMYLDRWQKGFMNIPTTAGGSLVLWVPQTSTNTSHLELNIKLNPRY